MPGRRAQNNRTSVTQREYLLAQLLGVRRTTLTLVARRLQTAGMIHYRRGIIHIVNRSALE
jgi:DNA-binding FadR family transcriptional regulator